MAARLRRNNKAMRAKAIRSPAQQRTALPAFIEPCLATLAEKAPDGDNWIHEIKFDGYRIQARLDNGKVKLLTRRGLDWTDKFPAIAQAIGKLPAQAALIDGELVVEGGDGISSFSLLQEDLKNGRHDRMTFYVFDLMHVDGSDIKALPLRERKEALARLLAKAPKRGPLRLSESLDGTGTGLVQARLQNRSGRHRLQAGGCGLSLRPRARLDQDQMLGPAGTGSCGLCAVERGRARGGRAGARLFRARQAALCWAHRHRLHP